MEKSTESQSFPPFQTYILKILTPPSRWWPWTLSALFSYPEVESPLYSSLAFPEHLVSIGLYAKFGGSDRPKVTCLFLENSANQEWYRWPINMVPWKELPHPKTTPSLLGQDLARPDMRGEASRDQVPLGAAIPLLQQDPCQEEIPGPSTSSIMQLVDTHSHLGVWVACWWRAHKFIIQHLPCVKCRDTLERGKQFNGQFLDPKAKNLVISH